MINIKDFFKDENNNFDVEEFYRALEDAEMMYKLKKANSIYHKVGRFRREAKKNFKS